MSLTHSHAEQTMHSMTRHLADTLGTFTPEVIDKRNSNSRCFFAVKLLITKQKFVLTCSTIHIVVLLFR